MNQPERRRGGGGGGGGSHAQRTGPSHTSRQGAGATHAHPYATGSGSGTDTGSGIGAAGADGAPDDNTPQTPTRTSPSKDRHRRQGAHAPTAPTAPTAPSSSSSAYSQQDERIAALERDLATAQREFQQELERLSQSETQTAALWQSKHSALNQHFLRTDTELRLLRSEADARELEREELRQAVDVLRRDLRERDDEVRALRAQVRGLKDFVSTSTRTDDQTSDEVFGDGMTRLGNGLQNWVIISYRRAKIDLSRVGEETLVELGDLVPTYEDLIHTSKVHLLQSVVSRILVDVVFSAYYVGLSDGQTQQFHDMELLLSSLCTSTDEPVNQWRSSTLALLRREAHLLQGSTDAIAESVTHRVTSLLTSLTISSTTTAASSEALRVLVKNAIELARLLVVQKARMRIHMPPVRPAHQEQVRFEPDTMEDIGGEDDDEDALAGREIACVVFPGLVKYGDENGSNVQFRNVIARAKVLCRPG